MKLMKLKSAVIVAAVASAVSVSAQAATVFSDNFKFYKPDRVAWTPQGGWTVTNGKVDLIGSGGVLNFIPGNGNAGTTYTLSFDLAGSQRNNVEAVIVKFGTSSATYAFLSSDPSATSTLNFRPLSDGPVGFSFQDLSADSVGGLLVNDPVTSVPEPRTYALFLAGLGIMGAIARRRTSNA